MALELDEEDWEDTAVTGEATKLAEAAAVFLSSNTTGKLEMDKLDDSAWTILSDKVIDSKLLCDSEVDDTRDCWLLPNEAVTWGGSWGFNSISHGENGFCVVTEFTSKMLLIEGLSIGRDIVELVVVVVGVVVVVAVSSLVPSS